MTATKHRRQRAPRTQQTVKEIIGRNTYGYAQTKIYTSRLSVDATVPDYAFYYLLRRGKQPGYKLGALFAPRIERVLAAWIFGEGVDVTLNKEVAAEYDEEAVQYTNTQLKSFVDGLLDSGQDDEGEDPDVDDQNGALLLSVFRDAVGLGDQYIIVNANGTLSVPSPDTVEVVRDELDYRHILAVRIVTKFEKATITDEYRADGRTVTIRRVVNGDTVETVENYANLIGRIQVIHIAYGRTGNETNGHSIHEGLLKLYDQYDDVLHKMLDGAKLLGNPILAFTGLEDLSAVVDANKPMALETYQDLDGNELTRPQLNIDRNSVLLIGKGGDAKFVAPPVGFTEDTKSALEILFWLLFEHIGIPEGMWGGELSSARATSETQLSQFAKELRGWQKDNGGWVAKLCKIWLQFKALTDPQLILDKLNVAWPAAIEEDKELLLKFVSFAVDRGYLTGETALRLLQLVENVEEEVEAGQAEAEARADDEQARMEAQVAAAAKAKPVGEMSGYNDNEATAIVAGAIRQLAGGD
jgi:hypothetical protein